MYNFSKAIRMPDKSGLRIEQMARVPLYDHGVGVLDDRGRMLSWIECADPDKREAVVAILVDLMNAPRRAKQPDWSFLLDGDEAPANPAPAAPQMHAIVPPRRQPAAEERETPPSTEKPAQASTTKSISGN